MGITVICHKTRKLIVYTLLLVLAMFPAQGAEPSDGRLPPPAFSHPGGFYDAPFSLHISSSVAGAEIYYTLDGSEPDPGNLNGSTYKYKNIWVHNPGDPDGEILEESITTYQYDSPIPIVDRSIENDRITLKASAFYNPPWYFPDSAVYKGTVVRAIAAMDGYETSRPVTHTFFIHLKVRERYTLPVVAITTAENNLFDYEKGIYTPGVIFDNWRRKNPATQASGGTRANYWQRGREWEYPAHFTFWDTGSELPNLSQDIGIRVHGGWSRSLPMKSLRIYARSDYGTSTLDYPFFPDKEYSSYKRLVLRNSGNDNIYTLFRDALIQHACSHMNFVTQAYRPVIVFFNGEYWGIHNIRERYDKHFIQRVYGVGEENLELISNRFNVKEGDGQHYTETLDYIEEFGLNEDFHYEYIKTRIDTENFIDYQIANIFASNTDWPGNNIDFWRKQTSAYEQDAEFGHDGRWRWMAFDMDFGFGLYNSLPDHNTLEFATAPNSNGWSNPPWSTFLLRNFLENADFRGDFINRFADQLNTAFMPARLDSLISMFRENLDPEFPEHAARWKRPYDMAEWNSHILNMRNFATQRSGHQWGHLMDYFELDTTTVTLDVSSPRQGYIRINDMDIIPATPGVPEHPYPWKGTYFTGVPVTFEAVPIEGYRFSHWEGMAVRVPVFTARPSEAAMITAHFEPAEIKDIIHYWHFNDLDGDDPLQAVAADYSASLPGEIVYKGPGDGYMDMVGDGTEINFQQGVEPLYGLRVRNPSDNRELVFSMPSKGFDKLELSFAVRRTTNGALNQTIYGSSDGGESWGLVKETYDVSVDWQHVRVDLSGFAGLNDNPSMQVKILFGGETASGESGNNRFDNITLTGKFLYERNSYYNKSGSNLNETASWGSEPDGTGQAPDSFDTPGVVYHIKNGDEATIAGNWAVPGILSGVLLGGGSDAVRFTIPPGHSFRGRMNVAGNATLVLQNTEIPELDSVSLLSTVVFEQDEMVAVPARTWGSLHLKGGMKELSGNYWVAGKFTAENTGLSFTRPSSLTLQGDLGYLGNVQTHDPENVNIHARGSGDQLFMAEAGNRVEVNNFYVEKTTGSFTAGTNIYAGNNLRLDFSGSAIFSDGGHTLQLGDDLRIRGDESNFELSGTILLKAGSGTNDMEINGVPLHNLVIDAGGDTRVDFNDAAPVIVIKNDLTIRSRSSRPVRLRDKQFNVRGNLLLDVEEPEQLEHGESFLIFNGENRQVLENAGYGGLGLLQNILVNGGGLQLEGSVTIDRLLGLENGMVLTKPGSILKLGPGGRIAQTSPGSYVNGPLGIYSNSTGPFVLEFPVGKDNGLHRVILGSANGNDQLRLYTSEYFNQAPPQHEPGEGILKILEGHGWYSIECDMNEETTVTTVALSYEDHDIYRGTISIAMVTGDKWINMGAEFPDNLSGMIRSTMNFTGKGMFALARKKIHPVFDDDDTILPLFPNPVLINETVYLPENMDVTLVNSSGITLRTANNTSHLNLQGIPAGIYFIRNREGQSSRLVILEN